MNNEIRSYIIQEVKPYYDNPKLDNIVDLFLETLNSDVNNDELNGVGNRIYSALLSLSTEKHDKSSLCILLPTISKVEPYARKVLCLTDGYAFAEISSEQKGFAAVLKRLDIKFTNGAMESVYNLRNLECHSCKDWTTGQCYDKINDSLVAYLIITNKRFSKLKQALNKNAVKGSENKKDFKEYANQLIVSFENKAKRTIQLSSEENLSLNEIFAEESIESNAKRRGTVSELINTIKERRMILWGDAGAGKTTTLEYLAYLDAKKLLEGEGKVPVLIYLGSATNEHYTLEEYIQQKLDIDEPYMKRMLRNGEINLYFDGYNEIPLTEMNMLKTKRRRELSGLLSEYKNTFIILTNRPQDGREFSGIPVFCLLKMDDNQIGEFLSKNVDDENVMSKVNAAIEGDENLKNMVKTPLILKRLIFITKTTGEIPKREGQIIGKFLNALFIREKQEKYDEYLDEKKLNYLLRRIGYETLESNHTNSGISEELLLDIMTKCQKDYHFVYDNLYALKLIVQLGIMEKRDDTYVFSHQSYQDYYHSQEFAAVLKL